MRLLSIAAAALALALTQAGAPAPLATSDERITMEPCTAFGGVDALCGTLTVPEDPQVTGGRTIDLAVTVLPATGPEGTHAPDPIFALHGGPGAAASFLAPLFAGIPARDRRDIVLVDQRGTGASNGMACTVDDAGEWLLLGLRFEMNPAGCPEFDADPTLYTTPIAMDDLDRVRAAMGYERVNLWGGSYGARAALVYMRRHPERVR